jgi:hypothetical protein
MTFVNNRDSGFWRPLSAIFTRLLGNHSSHPPVAAMDDFLYDGPLIVGSFRASRRGAMHGENADAYGSDSEEARRGSA